MRFARRWLGPKLRRRACKALCALAPVPAYAAEPAQPPQVLEPVVVTGSRMETRMLDAPYAIGVVDREALRESGPMVNLSESLARVPGIVANNRSNFAQDLQISSRGFGARATFGVRGLRLYTDGIPATSPDGAGQVTHFDLAGADRIEVLRGPFSALYGNSSGGVIALYSAPARSGRFELAADAGSFGTRQLRVGLAAPLAGGLDAQLQASRFSFDGFRTQMAAERDLLNLRLGWRSGSDEVVFLANAIDQPAGDPLGLTRAQFDADPLQTTPQAVAFDTRKTAAQQQVGVNWRRRFGGVLSSSEVTLFAGERAVTQWQSIAPATQANPRHPGGVIDFGRSYRGVDARLAWLFGPVRLVTGLNVEEQDEDRRGFENFSGAGASQQLGVTGALRRDEKNEVRSADIYAQGDVDLTENVTATLGVRRGRIDFDSRDAFLDNGDDSGRLRFSYANPVGGLRWYVHPRWTLYLSAGRGFESPTLNELAYRPDGSAGFNAALRPQKSRQLEAGAKWRAEGGGVAIDLALFEARTSDEIAVLTNAGGRSTFQNVGRTRRRGAELAARWQLLEALRASVALTLLDARYSDAFLACAGIPCSAPAVLVPAGNRIAGTNRGSAFAELAWKASDAAEFGVEARAQAATPVNDADTDRAAGYLVLALRARSSAVVSQGLRVEGVARIDNLLDRRYAGSVIVNEGNGRFFETAPPRSFFAGLRLIHTF